MPLTTVLSAVLLLPLSTVALAETDGISVTAVGEVKARPNRAEIMLATAGTAELTGDAVIKYGDALRRTIDAYDKLAMKNLSVEQLGVSFQAGGAGGDNNARFGNNNSTAKLETTVTRGLRLVLKDIAGLPEAELMQSISKLMDTARDSGATVVVSRKILSVYGNSQSGATVRFVVEDVDKLREQSRQKAFAAAQTHAERLARLAATELASVLSVEEIPNEKDAKQPSFSFYFMEVPPDEDSSGPADDRLLSEKFQEVPVRVTLKVRFALSPKK